MKSNLLALFLLLEPSAPGWAVISARMSQGRWWSGPGLAVRPPPDTAPRRVPPDTSALAQPQPPAPRRRSPLRPSPAHNPVCWATPRRPGCSKRALPAPGPQPTGACSLSPSPGSTAPWGPPDLTRGPQKCFQRIQLFSRRTCFNI